jgi:hypothetical protein
MSAIAAATLLAEADTLRRTGKWEAAALVVQMAIAHAMLAAAEAISKATTAGGGA